MKYHMTFKNKNKKKKEEYWLVYQKKKKKRSIDQIFAFAFF